MTAILNFIYTIFWPLEWLISWVMYGFHSLFVLLGMPDGPGVAWLLSIIFLVFVVRAIILPLFIRQMRSMRRLQALQPQLKKIQNKYKSKKDPASREAMSRETMKVYQDNHANPMGSCLPSLLQAPVFFSLYNLLRNIGNIAAGKVTTGAGGSTDPIGAFTKPIAQQIENTHFFSVKLSDIFSTTPDVSSRIIIGVFVGVMCLTMWYMQFHSVRNNTPRATMEGAQYRMQKIMPYIFPAFYLLSGWQMPFGVLFYWVTNNLWTLGQSLLQVRYMPTPGSPAAERKEVRDHKKENARRARAGELSLEEEELQKARLDVEAKQKGSFQRAQPSKKKRKVNK